MRTIAWDGHDRYIVAASANEMAEAFIFDAARNSRSPTVKVGSILAHTDPDDWQPIADDPTVTARALRVPRPDPTRS